MPPADLWLTRNMRLPKCRRSQSRVYSPGCRSTGVEGYTLREACLLARSSQPAQRAAACRLIAAVAVQALPTWKDACLSSEPQKPVQTQVQAKSLKVKVLCTEIKILLWCFQPAFFCVNSSSILSADIGSKAWTICSWALLMCLYSVM